MRDCVDHAPDLRGILVDDGVVNTSQPESTYRLLLISGSPDGAAGLFDLQFHLFLSQIAYPQTAILSRRFHITQQLQSL